MRNRRETSNPILLPFSPNLENSSFLLLHHKVISIFFLKICFHAADTHIRYSLRKSTYEYVNNHCTNSVCPSQRLKNINDLESCRIDDDGDDGDDGFNQKKFLY